MLIDEQLAAQAQPTVRVFQWKQPAVSLGYGQPPPAWVERSWLSTQGVEQVVRPTGGGIALHGSDLSFSVVAPIVPRERVGALMEQVAVRLTRSLRACGVWSEWRQDVECRNRITYCLTEDSPYALMIGKRKVGGLALRRVRTNWLIQGSILMRPLPAVFQRVLPEEVKWSFDTHSISLEEAKGGPLTEFAVVHALRQAWRASGALEDKRGAI